MANKVVLLKDVIEDTKTGDVLGINDRKKIISYIERAIEIAEFKANWNRYLGEIDVCSDECGCITMPTFVDTVLAVNINGQPAYPRNGWYQYHINGPGTRDSCGAGITYTWDDKSWSPTLQDLKDWSRLAADVEDPADGDGTKFLQVFGETVDGWYNSKDVLTIPTDPTKPSEFGVKVPLLFGYAACDPAATIFKRITRVIKPKTRGYVKLIGYNDQQFGKAVTLGYYAPNEEAPSYRRIRVGQKCIWCRVKFRRADVPLDNDYDVVPLPSRQACIDLIKAIRLRETNNIDIAEQYEQKALQLLQDIQTIEEGPGTFSLQVDPGFGIGTIDLR